MMTKGEVVAALDKIKREIIKDSINDQEYSLSKTKGGYFRVGNVAIKIAEITDLS